MRFLIFISIIAIIYTAAISLLLPTRNTQVAQNEPAASKNIKQIISEELAPKRPSRGHDRFKQASESLVISEDKPSISAKNAVAQTQLTDADGSQSQQGPEVNSLTRVEISMPQSISEYDVEHEDYARFEAFMKYVLSLLPDEINVRELLRPVEGTGSEKLREMGLRARAFKTFFDAWETLHLVTNGDDIYIRNDVVQYLRRHHDQVTLAETIRSYEAFRYFFQRLSMLLFPWTAPYFADHMTLHTHLHKGGRGIVLSAGDDQAPYLLTSIPSFRQLGCNLPIEVMYLGDSDLGEDFQAQLELLPGVITRDLSQMVNDEGWNLAGWAGKPFAILMSSFREVLFVDADALFFRNPEVLFEDPLYAQTGALFFKDRKFMPESKRRWLQQILPKPISKQVRQSYLWTGESSHMQESGVVVVDKWKHFVALFFVTRMNGPDRDGNEDEGKTGVYDMVYGDKETFWIGWELVGDQNYAFHKGSVGIMGKVQAPDTKRQDTEKNDGDSEQVGEQNEPASSQKAAVNIEAQQLDRGAAPQNFTICAPQLLHLGTDGRPLWFNGWILSNKFAGKRKKEVGTFEVYMAEPREVGEVDAWQLIDSNICCLTADETIEGTRYVGDDHWYSERCACLWQTVERNVDLETSAEDILYAVYIAAYILLEEIFNVFGDLDWHSLDLG